MSADRRSRLGVPLLAVLLLSLGLLALASAPAAQSGCHHARDAAASIALPSVDGATPVGPAQSSESHGAVGAGQPLQQAPTALVCAALVVLAGAAVLRSLTARSGRAGPCPVPAAGGIPLLLRKLAPDPIDLGLLRI